MNLFCVVSNALFATAPNVLVLFADDLGVGDLGVYGHPSTHTPNLDKLANDGLRFTDWYSGFHVCSPSRGTMMTGRIPIRWGGAGPAWTGGVFNSDAVGGLPANETSFASLMKEKGGYATMAIGKWHLGQQLEYLPVSHGFEQYYGIPYSVDMGPSAWDMYTSHDRPPLPLITATSSPLQYQILEQPTDLNLLSERYVKAATTFISTQSAAKKPWLLYYAFNHVHVPDFATPQFCNSTLRGRFGDALSSLDDAVGKVMAAVDAAGATQDTLTWFTSDNGPWLIKGLAGGSAGLFRDGKTTTWEGGVREPGIAHWPGTIAPAGLTHAIAATYDIFSTSLAVAGITAPSDRIIDGRDLSPLFTNTSTSVRGATDCIYIYKGSPGLKCPTGHDDCPGLWAIRCGQVKMHYVTSNWTSKKIQTFHDPPLGFHLGHDPGESFPLSSDDPIYAAALPIITAAKAQHLQTLRYVPNQMAKGVDPGLKVCCDPQSQKKHPTFPNCTCNPENFSPNFVCTSIGIEVDVGADGMSKGRGIDTRDSSTWPRQASLPFQEA